MKRLLFLSTTVCIVLLTGLSGCLNEEFSDNPTHILSFSLDTVSFDTVFTAQPSADKRLMVYNKNKKALTIQSVYLAKGENSCFIANIDGMKNTPVEEIDIYSHDSIYIHLRVNPSEHRQNSPKHLTDSLVFVTNGTLQYVKLEAYGLDAQRLQGKIITSDTTLTDEHPIIIYDSLVIEENATLRLTEGTRLYFHANASLSVKGRIVSEGSPAKPVILRGDRIDNLFDNLPYDYLSGQWGGVRLCHSSQNNKLLHTIIRSGNYGIKADSSDLTQTKLQIYNSVIDNIRGNALEAINCKMEIYNSQLSNAKTHCLYLLGGDYRFVHCTIANHYSWDIRNTVSVSVNNFRVDEKGDIIRYPLEKAQFDNTLIYGNHQYELELNNTYKREEVDAPFQYSFRGCLLKFKKQENAQFEQIVWNKDPRFKAIGDNDYLFDYRIDSASAAINRADYQIATECPTDLDGKNRLEDRQPDIGAYEFHQEKTLP